MQHSFFFIYDFLSLDFASRARTLTKLKFVFQVAFQTPNFVSLEKQRMF